jgi:chromodomain-helicase-DNA-binding protein 7
MIDEHIYYEGNSPTSPWNLILKQVLRLRTENLIALSVSGSDDYWIAASVTIPLIHRMEGADH